MKTVTLLQLAAALSSAFVIPGDQEVLNSQKYELGNGEKSSSVIPSKEDLKEFMRSLESSLEEISQELEAARDDVAEDLSATSKWAANVVQDKYDQLYQHAEEASEQATDYAWSSLGEAYTTSEDAAYSLGKKLHNSYFKAHEWFASTAADINGHDIYEDFYVHDCGHHGPGGHPHHPPPHGPPDEEPPPPHHPPPRHDHPPPPDHPHPPPEHDHPPPHPPPGHEHPPGDWPPHHPPPGHDHPPGDRPPHPPPGHERPPHPPPHHPPPGHDHPPSPPPPPPPPRRPEHPIYTNLTIFELLSKSNYTTEFAKLIKNTPALLKALNSTSGNYTVFAPLNGAFDKLPKNSTKLPKDLVESVLNYHVSPEIYPAGRVLVGRTIPTLLKSKTLGGGGERAQRIGTNVAYGGLTANFYSKFVVVDIFGKNGVIHGIDSILVPPPKLTEIINLLPLEFSTLELGLVKTGLFDQLNSTKYGGGTFFVPSNLAFLELGHRANAFLFSNYGLKYLKALLQYHITPSSTLYSDLLFTNSTNATMMSREDRGLPKGKYHFELPTLLQNKTLGVDVERFGRFIDITINESKKVAVSDVITADGVSHLVSGLLIPPKEGPDGVTTFLDSQDIEVDDLVAALEPYVEHDTIQY